MSDHNAVRVTVTPTSVGNDPRTAALILNAAHLRVIKEHVPEPSMLSSCDEGDVWEAVDKALSILESN